MTTTLYAPGKINLTLEVLDRRPDGYHALRSVMVPLALADELTVTPSPTRSFTCNVVELATRDNLVVRALDAVAPNVALSVELHKRIPAQAGLGGGSSDAAAVVRAASDGTLGPLESCDWLKVARQLGSDVPFFLTGTAALVEGTGERVTALGAIPPWNVIIIKPPCAISTAEAYATIDAHPRPSRPRSSSVGLRMVESLQRGDFSAVERDLSNDFHDLAVRTAPDVATAISALRSAGATNALLCGSGSCVFALAEDDTDIAQISDSLHLPDDYTVYRTKFAATPQWHS